MCHAIASDLSLGWGAARAALLRQRHHIEWFAGQSVVTLMQRLMRTRNIGCRSGVLVMRCRGRRTAPPLTPARPRMVPYLLTDPCQFCHQMWCRLARRTLGSAATCCLQQTRKVSQRRLVSLSRERGGQVDLFSCVRSQHAPNHTGSNASAIQLANTRS